MKQKIRTNLTKLTAIFMLLSIATANAQYQVPNASFESWPTTWNKAPQPETWNLSNVSQAGFDFSIGERSTRAHSGSYSVLCQDKEVGAFGITEVSPSWVTLGTPWAYLEGLSTGSATAGTYGGISWTARPDTMAVWVIRESAGNEDMNLVYYSWTGTATNSKYMNKNRGCTSVTQTDEESDICYSTDGNACQAPSGNAVQVAEGWLRTRATYNSWTQIKVPIKYFNNSVPQKMNIILSASNYPNKRANSGLYTTSQLYADDVTMIYSSKIYELRINGYAYSKFKKDVYEYTYEVDGTTMPTITCFRSDRMLSGNEISISYGQVGGAPTVITVKAEDGSSTTTYTIHFVAKRDTNQYPKSIKVNGTALPGFNAYVSDYSVALPYGTTELPNIEVVKANNKQTVEIKPYTIPGTAKVTVYAENTDYSVTYNITFSVKGLSDTTLQDILVNGVSIEGFAPTKTIYKVNVPVGTTGAQQITYVSAYPEGEQTVVVDSKDITETSTVTVSAPEATSSRVYRISYNVTESAYSYLQDLKVGGKTIEGFSPSVLNYTYPLPLGTTTVPEVTYTQGDAYQTVTKEDGGLDGVTKITVKAQNNINTSIYRISFPLSKSNNSKLADLKVGGMTISGFAPEVTSYSYVLPVGTTSLPEISWTQGDDYQTVKATYGGVNGTTKIVVTAQDGSVTSYSIAFSVVQATNSTLKDIQLDGVSLEGFTPENLSYSIVLPRGTKTLPVITYTPFDDLQKITKIEGGVNGVTRITVKAQSGDVSVYTLSFSVEKSDNSLLADIKVGGVTIEGFAPEVFNYSYELPAGTTSLPEITYVTSDEYQKVYITKGGVKGATTLRVVAESGTESIYTINFSVQKSESANLKNIFVGGTAIEGFAPDVYAYNYTLAEGVTESPVITVEKDGNQEVVITKPKFTGTASIKVIPEEGAMNIYTIKFMSIVGGDNLLKDIKLDGVTIENFSPEVTEYEIQLPQGTQTLPVITYEKDDEAEKVEVVEGGVNGVTTISVMAENGAIRDYNLNFHTSKSADGMLSDIQVNGVSIEGFDPAVYEYTYSLDKSATERPSIVPVKSNASARVDAVIPALYGDAKFQVVSEDGTAMSIYTVHIVYNADSDVQLESILVNGSQIEGFTPDLFTYEVSALKGTVPVVNYVKKADSQRVLLTNNGEQAALKVIAENGSEAEYTISFKEKPDNNVLLTDLQVYNAGTQTFESIPDFAADKYEYTVTMPRTSQDLYAINCVGAVNNQTYTITYNKPTEPVQVVVTAEDGVTTATYQVTFEYEKSSVCSLDNIMVNGETIDGFDPETFTYSVKMGEDNRKGVITYAKSDVNAKVVFADNSFDAASTITVTAEDGTEQVYTLNFTNSFDGQANTLKSILVNDKPVQGFAADTYQYTVDVNEGTVPNLTYTKNYSEQSVTVANGQGKGVITVKSNQEGVADAVYTINYNPIRHGNVLSTIEIDGVQIAGFDPYKTKYVVLVNDVPSYITAELPDGSDVPKSINTTNHVRFETTATSGLQAMVYDVYLHYTNDVVPNGEFTEWTKAASNTSADKPVGWHVPGDYAVKPPATFGDYDKYNYNTSYSVKKNGNSYAELNTVRNYWYLGGRFPGIMTIGDLNIELKNAGGSTSSVSGGITFRNTPDSLYVRYNAVSSDSDVLGFSDNNLHIGCTLSDGSTTKEYVYKSTTFNNKWVEQKLSLGTISSVTHPTIFNIWINSCKYDNAKDMGFYKAIWDLSVTTGSQLLVDYVRLRYNSKIRSIKVNGTDATLSGTKATATIDAEAAGLPQIVIAGEVDDQMYSIDYGTEVNGVRTVAITSYAEDMSSTTYTLTVTRPLSSIAGLKSLAVGGEPLAGFDPAVYEYTVSCAAGAHFMPDVEAVAVSSHQNTVASVSGKVLNITTTSEDGSATHTYKITFVEEDADNAKLSSIDVEGYTLPFEADKTEYNVTLATGTNVLPYISVVKSSDTQSATLTEGGVEGVTSINVKSADGSAEKQYTIAFTVAPDANTNSELASMLVPGAIDQIPFAPDTKDYTYGKDFADAVAVAYTRAYAEDKMVVTQNNDSVVWNLSNEVSSTANEYKLKFINKKSDDATLADITLNGTSIEDFNPYVYEYNIKVASGVNDVKPVMSSEAQQLATLFDAATGTYQFNVVAADGVSSQSYTVVLEIEKSADNELKSITLDGTQIADFDPATTEYGIILPVGTEKVPEIMAEGCCLAEKLDLTVSPIGESSIVDVTAENGDERTYVLNFTVAQSDNALLNGISANFVALPDFEPQTFNYTVEVASGSEDPVITYVKGDEFQTVETNTTENSFIIVVKAQSGAENTYTVNFDRKLASGSDLADITLDGVTVSGFAPSNYEYSVELVRGTTMLPAIETVMGDAGQSIVVTTNGVNGDAVIAVTSQDGQNHSTYTIHFSVAKSDNADLAMIYLDGVELTGFAPATTEYNVTLPVGVTVLPVVTYEPGDAEQTITKSVDGTVVKIDVKAGNGNVKTYTVNFTIVLSTDATLKMIYVNGDEIAQFSKDVLEYSVVLPLGTDISKVVVDYLKSEEYQSVESNAVEGGVELKVTAQNPEYTQTYRVNIDVEKSTNTLLSDLMSGGVTVPNFEPENVDYFIELPIGTEFIPDVTYTAGDEYQTIVKSVSADSLLFTVVVTAQNMDFRTYTVRYTKELSHNATLKSITLGDERQLIPSFDGDVFVYNVKLPYGTTTVPSIDYEPAEADQEITTNYTEDLHGTSTITVLAADKVTSNTYSISFSVELCNVTTLDMIFYDGKEVEGFSKDDNDYDVTLPYGTVTAPEVTYTLTVPEGEIASVQTTTVQDGWRSVISVKAESGDENEYVVNFAVAPDSETRLSNIKVFGKTVEGFDPEKESYEFVLPAYSDSTLLPYPKDVEYVKMSSNESVEVSQPARESVIIKVTAPSGDVRNYVIKTTIKISDNTALAGIFYKDVLINGFDPAVLEYSIKIPFGATNIDKDLVTYETQEPGQTVMVVKDNLDVQLQVMAQDGESHVIYVVHFVPDEFDPTAEPSQTDVCITSTPDGSWKFTTKCKKVMVILTDLSGRFLAVSELPTVDPNCEDICSPDAEGFLYKGVRDQIVTYNFFYAQKRRVLTGKFKCQ